MNLKEWQNSKVESFRQSLKEKIRNDEDIDTTFFSEDEIAEIKEEVLIEDYSEIVDFEGTLDLEEIFKTDLNDTDCDCPDDEEDCSCPEEFYDFIPNEYGEMMDL